MKTYILRSSFILFALALMCKVAFSQTEYTFPLDATSKWNVVRTYIVNVDYPPPPHRVSRVEEAIYYFDGDTLINGILYKNLYADIKKEKMLSANQYDYYFHKFVCRFYQINGKVYQTGPSVLLYDYNVTIGDTLRWEQDSKVIVEDTARELINGRWLRTYYTHNYAWPFPFNNKYIEGIGSKYGLVNTDAWYSYADRTSRLICYSEQGMNIISPWDYDYCHLFVGTEELIGKSECKIVPNPFNNVATLNFNSHKSGKYYLRVNNTLGQLVMNLSFQNEQPVLLNSKNFKKGIYFYQVFDNSNHCIYAGKFVVN